MFILRLFHPNQTCRSYQFPYRLSDGVGYWRPGYSMPTYGISSGNPFDTSTKLRRLFTSLGRHPLERLDYGDPTDTLDFKLNDGCILLDTAWSKIELEISLAFCLEIKNVDVQ